jgi:hypothetical protein
VEQTTEDPMTGTTAMTTMAANTEATDEAPEVRLQPCAAFHFEPDAPWPACGDCGWLEDDHTGAVETGGAEITELPRRRVPLPQRLAS